MKKRLTAGLLALALLLLLPAAACAEEARPLYRIADEREFIGFLSACAREGFSRDRRFELLRDLDLTGLDCESAPYFAGEFDGGGHTVRGLRIERAGSRLGLFRQLGEGGVIRNLRLEGTVTPTGTREDIGGLVGLNEGTVENCTFTGEVRGLNRVGGLVGCNRGSLRSCTASGMVCGEHRVGGLAGLNEGLAQSCETDCAVNAEEITPSGEKRFDLAMLSQDSFVDLSDIGGVAGENTGVLAACAASGTVGFRYTGYNVGGVAGKNSGFVDACRASGSVEGRRDVGGIVGQSVPYAAWELSEGTLRDLSRAIGALNAMLASAAKDFGDRSGETLAALQGMKSDSDAAANAVRELLNAAATQTSRYLADITVDPDTGELVLPPVDIHAADTTPLTNALGSLNARMRTLTEGLDGTVGETAEAVREISGQMGYVFNLLFAMMGELGEGDFVSTRDLSFAEAYEHDEGAIQNCLSTASVRAETNAGGVVGTVAFELSFDMEDQLAGADFLPTHAERLLFAAVRGCENAGEVVSRSDGAGGIVARLDAGAVVDCVSRGRIVSLTGDYVGGVAGEAGGTLARCWACCALEGGKYVGGIAGRALDLRDCRVRTQIERASEYAGAVAGWAEGAVSGNCYAAGSPEGVDGVARLGACEAMTDEELLALDGAPRELYTLTLRFLDENGALLEERSARFGDALGALPQRESRGGAAWVWDARSDERLYCDREIAGAYLGAVGTLSSGEEFPLFLVEGDFFEGQTLAVEPFDEAPEGERRGGYTLAVDGYDGVLTVRMRSEGGEGVCLPDGDGWRRAESVWDGRYLVFSLDNGGSFAVMAERESRASLLLPALGGAGLLALILLARGLGRRKKKRAADAAGETGQND